MSGNTAAALLLATYLLFVAKNRNGSQLSAYLSQEGGFVGWAAAALTVYYLADKAGRGGDAFFSIVILALIIQLGPATFNELSAQLDKIRNSNGSNY